MAKTSVKEVNMVMQVVKEMQLKYQVVQKKSYPSTRWTRHQTYLSVNNMQASEPASHASQHASQRVNKQAMRAMRVNKRAMRVSIK